MLQKILEIPNVVELTTDSGVTHWSVASFAAASCPASTRENSDTTAIRVGHTETSCIRQTVKTLGVFRRSVGGGEGPHLLPVMSVAVEHENERGRLAGFWTREEIVASLFAPSRNLELGFPATISVKQALEHARLVVDAS